MRISLVTYTYNDQAFVHDLLGAVKNFNIPLAEIIVADDASSPPYQPVGTEKVLRQQVNLGPAGNKAAGLAAATGDVLFSIDADVRPAAKWPGNALKHLANPQVGLVGCSVKTGLADNCLSRALHHLGREKGEDEEAPFLPGAAWLIRRQVWEALGGFGGFTGRTHEDYLFSRRVAEAGLKLVAANAFPVYETRRVHRLVYCKRQKLYLAQPLQSLLQHQAPERLFADLAQKQTKILAWAEKSREWGMAYINLLDVAHTLSGLRAEGAFKPDAVLPALLRLLAPYPASAALLLEDLRKLAPEALCENENSILNEDGTTPLYNKIFCSATQSANSGQVEYIQTNALLEAWFAPLRATALPELEKEWISRLRAEDALAAEKFDLHYLT